MPKSYEGPLEHDGVPVGSMDRDQLLGVVTDLGARLAESQEDVRVLRQHGTRRHWADMFVWCVLGVALTRAVSGPWYPVLAILLVIVISRLLDRMEMDHLLRKGRRP